MNRKIPNTLLIAHAMLAALLILICLPGAKTVKSSVPMLVAILLIQVLYLIRILHKKEKIRAASDLMLIIWAFLLLWEILVTKMDCMHPVLVPAPENVFYVFYERPLELLVGVWSSIRLLIGGSIIGVCGGVIAGLVCGWIKRLRDMLFPIANVLAPIPSIVFAPYVVALMPSFRSASYVVIILGIFWPTFLKILLRVDSIDQNLIESARIMRLTDGEMIFQILLPFTFPEVVRGLKVTLTTAVMMLTFAEMMGATSGMGYFIVNYNTYGNYTNVVAGIVVVGIVVTVLNRLTGFLQKKLIKWKP